MDVGVRQSEAHLGGSDRLRPPADPDRAREAPREGYFQPARFVRDDKVIRGRDGWLFLAADSNDVLGQHTGRIRLSAHQLETWRRLLVGRKQRLEALGASYVALVAPNTHAVYEEKLPLSVRPTPRRPIHQIQDHLLETGAEIPLIYPLDDLKAARHRAPVCCKTDSHWNEFGAFVVYQRVIDSLTPLVPVRRVHEDEILFFDHDAVSTDLAHKLDNGEHASWRVAWIRHAGARLLQDNCVESRGGLIVTECPYAQGTCLLVGDSYSWALLKFFAESFRRLIFVQRSTFDYDLVERERPDVVVNLMAERFLVCPPDDEGAPTVLEEARLKHEVGRSRPLIPFWSINRRPSLYEADDLIARLRADGRSRDAAIVSVLAYAGLTPEEVLELRWSDVGKHELAVWRRFARPSRVRRLARRARRRLGLGPRPTRSVAIFSPLRDALEEWRAVTAGSGPMPARIFPADHGGAWKPGDWRAWRSGVAAEYGLGDWRPYSLRHVFCSLLLNAGTPPEEVARRLGTTLDRIVIDYGSVLEHVAQGDPVPVETQVGWALRLRAAA
jgi:alginate O-acetyltransferase complex protein AlgJ